MIDPAQVVFDLPVQPTRPCSEQRRPQPRRVGSFFVPPTQVGDLVAARSLVAVMSICFALTLAGITLPRTVTRPTAVNRVTVNHRRDTWDAFVRAR